MIGRQRAQFVFRSDFDQVIEFVAAEEERIGDAERFEKSGRCGGSWPQ